MNKSELINKCGMYYIEEFLCSEKQARKKVDMDSRSLFSVSAQSKWSDLIVDISFMEKEHLPQRHNPETVQNCFPKSSTNNITF